MNLARHQLPDAQKTLIARQIEPDFVALARQRMAEAGKKSAPGKPGADAPPIDAERPKPKRVRDEVAAAVGIGSGDTYERHKHAIEEAEAVAPDLMPAVATDDPKITSRWIGSSHRPAKRPQKRWHRPLRREPRSVDSLVSGVANRRSGHQLANPSIPSSPVIR